MQGPRRHGCESPLHPSQIAVVAIGLLSALVFYVFSVQELPVLMQRTVVSLYSVQLCTTTLLYIIISRFDPGQSRDQVTYPLHSSTSAHKAQVNLTNSTTGLITTMPDVKASPDLSKHSVVVAPKCHDCGRIALTPDTKHCSRCNKCIPGYDHHCIYLNTCIGLRNYPLFVGLLSCSILLLLTQQIVSSYAVLHLLDTEPKSERYDRVGVLCALSILPLLELLFLIILSTFHLYIAFRGLTTHEWLNQWLQRRKPEHTATGLPLTVATMTAL